MEDWDEFRAVLVERTAPAKRRRERLAKAATILVVFGTLLLVIVLVVLVHDRMPALVGLVKVQLSSAGEPDLKSGCPPQLSRHMREVAPLREIYIGRPISRKQRAPGYF